jgi:polysaccharide pyruvyl transferase WcaK-like protein
MYLNGWSRRQFLGATLLPPLTSSLAFARREDEPERAARILVRSSWQTVNIGDIAHTPGILSLLQMHIPSAELYLWPSKLNNGVEDLLRSHFPKLKIVGSEIGLQQAFEECDFLLHGSGASLVAERDVVRWHATTGKPYGVYGITLPPKKSSATIATSPEAMKGTIDVLSNSRFVFFRDSKSLEFARQQGCNAPLMEFGPDAAFACDLRDKERAEAFLNEHDLQPQQFLCCIPRLRYTPYWTIPEKGRKLDPVKHARNEAMKEHDHAPLRQAIIEVVQQTELKVLICPEDQTQMRVGKELILDKLPDTVRRRVVWRPNYWLTGEAISTYIRSAGLFGNEMHSPIMCIGHAIPAIVCRWAEQTTKGFMWEDIGLGDWLFDLDDESQVEQVVPAVLNMAIHANKAKAKAETAREFVRQRQRETMQELFRHLPR